MIPLTLTAPNKDDISGEGFFTNGSSYLLPPDVFTLSPGRRMGFSFKTCAPGELIRQTGGRSLDQLQVREKSH